MLFSLFSFIWFYFFLSLLVMRWTPKQGPKWRSRSSTGLSSRRRSPSGPSGSWGSSNTWNMRTCGSTLSLLSPQTSPVCNASSCLMFTSFIPVHHRSLVCWMCSLQTFRWTGSMICKCSRGIETCAQFGYNLWTLCFFFYLFFPVISWCRSWEQIWGSWWRNLVCQMKEFSIWVIRFLKVLR